MPITIILEKARKKHEIINIMEWNFKDLEDFIIIDQDAEFTQKGYPGLKIENETGTGTKTGIETETRLDSNNRTDSNNRQGSKNRPQIISLRLFKSEQAALESHCQGIKKLFQFSFSDDFKALRKDINASSKIKQMAPYFNGQTKFQQSLFNLITHTLFEKNIRTKKVFDLHAKAQINNLYNTGQKFIKTFIVLGREYQSCFELIQKLSFQYQKKEKPFNILTGLFKDLKHLVPQNFADLYDYERIKHLNRYIACIRIRAQRAVDNPLKEEKKALQLSFYTRHLNNLLDSLSKDSTSEKSQKIEQFFWLLEEYKISLFAPELKTAIKISAKKLDQFLIQMSTMI
ncbi:MAG: DUF3418 domain-containing protein [Desulfobacula sp.]|nr:DUF3418 domain-containing protein [Desulfobacula sp.]